MIRVNGKRTVSIWLICALLGISFTLGGCLAATPTGSEFQKETTPSSKTKAETQQTTPTPAGKIEGYEIYENKDPFSPLVGGSSSSPSNVGRNKDGTTSTTGAAPTGSATVKLVTIPLGASAAIEVNGTLYEGLRVGDTFAEYFKLLSIGTGSVVIQYGDNQYTIYLGETINVG
ncbi:MAG: hypothetical protein WC891_07620 [Actinomycetota bacterium]